MRTSRVTRAAMMGMLVASGCAALLAVGPFAGAIVNSVIVEVAIAQAAHLPVPVLLPAALDGLGGIALICLAATAPDRTFRAWLWTLVFAALGASMGANGAHAAFLDAHGHLVLPPWFEIGVAFIPPLSAAATAHLLLVLGQRVVALTSQILAHNEATRFAPASGGASAQPRLDGKPRPAPATGDARDPRVLRLAQAGRGYRSVMEATGWTRGRATHALKTARAHLRTAQAELRSEGAAA